MIQSGVVQAEQPTIDRGAYALERTGERDARSSLRAQVTRLERELSAIVADGFPHISPTAGTARGPATPGLGVGPFQGTLLADGSHASGPRLLSLEQLERLRDELAGRVQELRRRAQDRAEHEHAARELLASMKLEPGRYKFVRLPVRDLGLGGCGVWEVRPRLGLIGMLAGWWQLKLSAGCPLPRGSRPRRGPDPLS